MKKAREDEEKKAETAARAARAVAGFAEVEAFARANWTSKAEVVRQYRTFSRTYSDLDLGKEAKRRADGIEKNQIHPHPDRTIASTEIVDAARAAWNAARDQVETAITERRYEDALRLLPTTVEDPEGNLADELSIWRVVVRELTDFHTVLGREVGTLKGDARKMTTGKGAGTLTTITSAGPQLRIKNDVVDVPWADVPAAEVAALAQRAFAGKDIRLQERLAGYAWAHKIRDVFYSSAVAVKVSGSGSSSSDTVERLLARAKSRFGD
jgi:hypothetical protein